MVKLNLLTIENKKQIAKNTSQIILVNHAISMTIVLVAVSLMLVGSQQYLDYQLKTINSTESTSSEETSAAELNRRMKQVVTVQADYVKWSRIIQNFLRLMSEGNQIHRLSFDKDSQKLTVQGVSEKRSDFLELENNLKESDLTTEVKSPISNLLYQTNINFSLEAKLNI